VAHELGHNFGMNHDGQPGSGSSCDANDGLMGYGSTTDRFSTCSLDGMANYFGGDGHGLRCLGTGWDSDVDDALSSVVSNVGQNGTQLYGCGGVDCVFVVGLPSIYNNSEGYYAPERSSQNNENGCHDQQLYYRGPNEEYLCFNSDAERWFLTWTMCSDPFVMSSATGGHLLSAEYWSAYGYPQILGPEHVGFYVQDSVRISECGGNQAFMEETECLNSMNDEDEICISTANNQWDGDRTFLMLDDLCLNDHPVYHFVVRSGSEFVEYDNVSWSNESYVVEEVAESTYYVHYELVYLDVTGNETVGQWLLTLDEISENYMARCDEEVLTDCTAGSWMVRGQFVTERDMDGDSHSEGGSVEMEVGDGLIMDVLDEFMTVRRGNCDSLYSANNGNDDGEYISLWVIVLVVMSVLIICIISFLVVKSRCRGDDKHSIPDSEEAELDVEVQVKMSTENGNAEWITTTQV